MVAVRRRFAPNGDLWVLEYSITNQQRVRKIEVRWSAASHPSRVRDGAIRVHYCDGTYVGSCVAESMTDPYAVTRPVPLSTFTVTRAL